MVTRPGPTPHRPIDPRRFETGGKVGAEQDVIEAQAGIPLPSAPQVVPECVDALFAMHLAQSIPPALLEKAGVGGALSGWTKASSSQELVG